MNTDKILCLAVLCIWNWSLMQFTILIPGNQGKAINLNASACEKAKEICCNLDVWGILVTVILQVGIFIFACIDIFRISVKTSIIKFQRDRVHNCLRNYLY